MDEFEKWLEKRGEEQEERYSTLPTHHDRLVCEGIRVGLLDALGEYRAMTCKILAKAGYTDWCSECDFRGMYDTMHYCPNCGRKVIPNNVEDETEVL